MTLPLVIVGAGIAGLATALALRRHGIDVTLLERRPSLPREGAGIQIGPNGTHVLRRLGLLDAVAAQSVAVDHIDVEAAGRDGTLARLPLGTWMQARHGAPYFTTLRAHLQSVLYDAVIGAGAVVRFNADVVRITEDSNGVDVVLNDGETIRCAGLIGADGAWSAVRSNVFEAAQPALTGRIAARGRFQHAPHKGALQAVRVTLSAHAHLVTYPVTSTEANAVLITSGQQQALRWSQPIDASAARERLAAFGERGAELATLVSTWRQWPLVQAPRLSCYARGRVALVGDAAHAMMPFLAQGAVMALEDAEILARRLQRGTDAAVAFAQYSDDRLSRTQRVVAAAEQNGRIYHLTGPMALARNAFLRIAPGDLLMRRYDWLYGGATEVPI